MKSSLLLLLLPSFALGQTSEKIITFDRANTKHCKVAVVGGKPLLESTFEGTTVAIGMPVNRGDGEFAIFVVVSRIDPGAIQVTPKGFYGLFSDSSHTRFAFADEAAELPTVGPQSSYLENLSGNGQAGAHALAVSIVSPPLRVGRSGVPPMLNSSAPGRPTPAVYLRHGKVKQGATIFGWIIFRQPKTAKTQIHPTDMLDEIDIPVNGMRYRF